MQLIHSILRAFESIKSFHSLIEPINSISEHQWSTETVKAKIGCLKLVSEVKMYAKISDLTNLSGAHGILLVIFFMIDTYSTPSNANSLLNFNHTWLHTSWGSCPSQHSDCSSPVFVCLMVHIRLNRIYKVCSSAYKLHVTM